MGRGKVGLAVTGLVVLWRLARRGRKEGPKPNNSHGETNVITCTIAPLPSSKPAEAKERGALDAVCEAEVATCCGSAGLKGVDVLAILLALFLTSSFYTLGPHWTLTLLLTLVSARCLARRSTHPLTHPP